MSWDRIAENWQQVKGKIREQWRRLSDDQIDAIGGHREQLAGKIQALYGLTKDEAEKQINEFATAFYELEDMDADYKAQTKNRRL